MIISAHQPGYVPWLGFFNKIYNSDIFCVMDDVEFSKGDYINRNRIKIQNGWSWLTVPVQYASASRAPIKEILIDNKSAWQKKHLNSLVHNYKRAPYFELYKESVIDLLHRPYKYLFELNMEWINFGVRVMNISTPIIKASELSILGKKSDYILEMSEKLNASIFIFGEQGREYAVANDFKIKGIDPVFQTFQVFEYPQLGGLFEPRLSFLDALFNVGPEINHLMAKSWIYPSNN